MFDYAQTFVGDSSSIFSLIKNAFDSATRPRSRPCFTISLIHKKTFNPFDSVPLATLRFELSRDQKRMTLQNFLQNIEHRVDYKARKFENFQFVA